MITHKQAFFIVASIITNNKLVINNLNKDSKQGDKEILSIIKNMGVNYEFTNDGLVIIPSKELKSIFIDLKDIPDLGPILMVLASTLENTTTPIFKLID